MYCILHYLLKKFIINWNKCSTESLLFLFTLKTFPSHLYGIFLDQRHGNQSGYANKNLWGCGSEDVLGPWSQQDDEKFGQTEGNGVKVAGSHETDACQDHENSSSWYHGGCLSSVKVGQLLDYYIFSLSTKLYPDLNEARPSEHTLRHTW